MIVFCCGMSRSAGTAHYQAVKEMVEITGHGHGAGFINKKIATKIYADDLAVYKAEIYRQWMGKLIKDGQAIALGIYRNFLDVFVSLMHFYQHRYEFKGGNPDGSFESILNYMAPQVLAWQQNWERHTDCWLRYENVWNLGWETALADIADYIGLPVTHEHIELIEQRISQDHNRQVMKELREENRWINGSQSLITRAHISPTGGAPGVWRNMLTSEQCDRVLELAGDWMEAHGYVYNA